ncbi:putative G-protein coupled receptor 139 [Rhinoraja longicauda]
MGYAAIYYIASIYYPILAAIGIIVNLTAIVILRRGKCGLSQCITRYLVLMAAADLAVVFVTVIVEQINNIYVLVNFLLITPVCAVTLVLRIATTDWSVWFTVAFTFDRYIAISCQRLRKQYCTERTANVVAVTVGIVSSVRCIPFYFMVEPYEIIDRVPWRCVQKAEIFTSPYWKALILFDGVITPLLPICLIIFLNGLTVKNIIAANNVRRSLMNITENKKDPEMENRRKSMTLLFALSANFILLWMPFVIHAMIWQAENYFYSDRYLNSPVYIAQQFGFMLQFLSSCTNTCIYGLTQRKFRDELKNGMKYIFTLNGRLFK